MAYYSRPGLGDGCAEPGGISIIEGPCEIIVSDAGPLPVTQSSVVSNRSCCEPLRTYIKEPAPICCEPTPICCEPSVTRKTYIEPVVIQPSVCVTRTYEQPISVTRTYEQPSSVARTYMEPVKTYVGPPKTVYNEVVAVGEPIYRSPIKVEKAERPLTYLESEPEPTDTDWVVVEKAPRGSVRHNIVDTAGGIRTADGRYIIGDAQVGKARDANLLLGDYSEGILRLPDGRIKYADGTIQPGTPGRMGFQGSIVALSDGSILLPDGTIEYPDGTIRKPTNPGYSNGVEYSERAWGDMRKNNQSNLAAVNDQIAQLREQMKAEVEAIKSEKAAENTQLRNKLQELETEKKIYEKELTIMKEQGPSGWAGAVETLRTELRDLQGGSNSPQYRESLQAKEDHLKMLHEQFLVEARANAEARGLLHALQDERAREAETRQFVINEAVMRKEQEVMREKDRMVAEIMQKNAAEKEALIAKERAQAERMMENEINLERRKMQAELQQVQQIAEAERKRAEDEHLLATVERERALAAEEQLAALRLATPEKKKKKKKKKKGKKGKKGKGKAKAKPSPYGVIGNSRLISKAPARR